MIFTQHLLLKPTQEYIQHVLSCSTTCLHNVVVGQRSRRAEFDDISVLLRYFILCFKLVT